MIYFETSKKEKGLDFIDINIPSNYSQLDAYYNTRKSIYEEKKGEWLGGRLGVAKEYRTFSKFICPHLFKSNQISALYYMSIAAGLIYRAVSLANFIGCHKFSAYVQEQNVKLFKRLHWSVIEATEMNGKTHFLMEADLDAYPATPIYTTPIEANNTLSSLAYVA